MFSGPVRVSCGAAIPQVLWVRGKARMLRRRRLSPGLGCRGFVRVPAGQRVQSQLAETRVLRHCPALSTLVRGVSDEGRCVHPPGEGGDHKLPKRG